jgi:hypothetical protein
LTIHGALPIARRRAVFVLPGGDPMQFFSAIRSYTRSCIIGLFSLALSGCGATFVTPENIRPPDPANAYNAIEAEPAYPTRVVVRDFDFEPSSVTEDQSIYYRAIDLFRKSSEEDRQLKLGRKVAATLSKETAKRLRKTGLHATRIASDNDMSMRGNFLLVTGHLVDADEGNQFTRVAFGFGIGESRLATEVHVFRVVNGEKAEVLVFTTHAKSGEMPGMAASIGFGELLLGPITAITAIEDALSSGQKIYSSQIDYLAANTGDQVARYLAQYSAAQHWIPKNRAKPVHLES